MPSTITTPPQSVALESRMRGRLITSTDPEWDEVRQVFNLTTDVDPPAIALPRDADDVVAAVEFARAGGLRVAPQATGHNAAAHGDFDDALLVDVRELDTVEIDAERRRVRVGAGVRWHQVTARLSELGLAALHGSSPLVGIAGYSLGGGMGWLARKHGLQTNSVTALELVTAEGEHIRADADHHPDLFWALRGGNGNYGVVTAIEFEVYPLAELYAGGLFFPLERAREVLRLWTSLTPGFPDEMMTWAQLMRMPDDPGIPEPLRGGEFAVVLGAFIGEEAEGAELLRPLRDLGADIDTFAMVPPAELGDLAMDPPEPLPVMTTTALLDDLPADTIDDLLSVVGSGTGSPVVLAQIRQMGGALGRETAGAGARATLAGRYSLLALGVPVDEATAGVIREALDDVDRAVLGQLAGKYPNFVEEPARARSFFGEETWARLTRVKAAYDPTALFKGNHEIPVATES